MLYRMIKIIDMDVFLYLKSNNDIQRKQEIIGIKRFT